MGKAEANTYTKWKIAFVIGAFSPYLLAADLRPSLSGLNHCESLLHSIQRVQISKITLHSYPNIIPFRRNSANDISYRLLPPMRSSDPRFIQVERILNFANEAFEKIRGWTDPKFLAERKELARRFSETSEYIRVFDRRNAEDPAARLLGILGATVAYSDEADIYGALPMEFSVGWKIDLPFKMELRAYAMPEPNNDVFAKVFSGLMEIVGKKIKQHPEIIRSNCLFTYGDRTGVALYRRMGFELADEATYPPIEHDGIVWRVLVISPEKLIENFNRIQSEQIISDVDNAIRLTTTTGREFEASGFPGIELRGGRLIRMDFKQNAALTEEISVQAGGTVVLFENGTIKYVSKLERTFRAAGGMWAAPGSGIGFFPTVRCAILKRHTNPRKFCRAYPSRKAAECGPITIQRITFTLKSVCSMPPLWTRMAWSPRAGQ